MASLIGGSLVVATLTSANWLHLLVPIPTVFVGYILSLRAAAIFPRIRYIDSREIDGHGYVHQPLGPMLLVCLIGFAFVIGRMVR